MSPGSNCSTGELAFEDVLNEPFPGHSYIPSECPGLF